jgi:hypothetical protein
MNAAERSDDFAESARQWASSFERESPMRAESAQHPTFPSIPSRLPAAELMSHTAVRDN